ncbi:TlpA disulfide reductase family protein [Streptosporangium sp. NPDC000396]|uniref:TlpA disulfide reductase family protein n=1 Tax=Streptosporangium sp. NPDC000396 TaxID=3366185 RepID=UPI00369CCE9D
MLALVVVLTVISLLNLFLTVGLLGKVREQADRLAKVEAGAPPMLPNGAAINDFTTTTLDGERLTLEELTGEMYVGFFNWNCEVCHEHLPAFIAEAKRMPGRRQVLAVVRGTPEQAVEMTSQLNPVARVVVEEKQGPVQRAFQLYATPAFCILNPNHTIQVSGYEPGLKTPARS